MSWDEAVLMSFDVESTGVDTETDRIVTCCVGVGDPKLGSWLPKNWLLTQAEPIPAEATAIHGITTEHANTEGVDPKTALAEIRDAILAGWRRGWVLVAYNVTYDLTILDRELRRHGLGTLTHIGPTIDPLVIDREVNPDKYLKREKREARLAEIYAKLGLSEDDTPGWTTLRVALYRWLALNMGTKAHGAEADAYAAMRLAHRLADCLPWSPHDNAASVRMMLDWQADAYRQQRTSFAAYKRKQGDTEAASEIESRLAWPMEPYDAQPELGAIA